MTYPTMPEGKGFHELAYAVNVDWKHDVQQPAETVAAHDALVEKHSNAEKLVTAKDLRNIIDQVRAKCAAFNVSATEIEKIVASISGNIGAPRTQLDDIAKQAMAEANQAIGEAKDNFIQNAMNAELSMHQQYEEMRQLDKQIDKSVDELYAEGLISKDRYEQLKKDKAAADALPEGSAARIAADRKYNENLTKTLKQADEAATTPEQHDHIAKTQSDADKRITMVNQQDESRARENQPKVSGPTHHQLGEPTAQAAVTQQPNPVTGSNKNVQAPTVDKDVADILSAAASLHGTKMAEAFAPPVAPSTTPSQATGASTQKQVG